MASHFRVKLTSISGQSEQYFRSQFDGSMHGSLKSEASPRFVFTAHCPAYSYVGICFSPNLSVRPSVPCSFHDPLLNLGGPWSFHAAPILFYRKWKSLEEPSVSSCPPLPHWLARSLPLSTIAPQSSLSLPRYSVPVSRTPVRFVEELQRLWFAGAPCCRPPRGVSSR